MLTDPGAPPLDRVLDRRGGVEQLEFRLGQSGAVVQRKPGTLAFCEIQAAAGAAPLDLELDRGREQQGVGTAERAQAVGRAAQLGGHQPVLGPRHELDRQLHGPAENLDQADEDVRGAPADLVAASPALQHQSVGETGDGGGGPKGRPHDHRVLDVLAFDLERIAGPHGEMPGIVVEQPREDAARIEALRTPPVDRAVARDQSSRVAIAEQREV